MPSRCDLSFSRALLNATIIVLPSHQFKNSANTGADNNGKMRDGIVREIIFRLSSEGDELLCRRRVDGHDVVEVGLGGAHADGDAEALQDEKTNA